MSLFEKNLSAMRKHYPKLADWVVNVPSYSDNLEKTPSGLLTLKLEGEDGTLKSLTRRDPIREAKKILFEGSLSEDPNLAVEAQIPSGKLLNSDSVIMLGFGLGYEAQLLAEKTSPGCKFYVIEKSPELFRTAMDCADLTFFFNLPHIDFVLGKPADEVYTVMKEGVGDVFVSTAVYFLRNPAALNLFPTYYLKAQSQISEFFRVGEVMMRTALVTAKESLDNRLCNLSDYAQSVDLKDFKDRFLGRPAIVVLTGPSLARNIDLLRETKGRAPIICVSSTLKLLLEKGIVPDYTMLLDFQRVSLNFFNEIPEHYQIPMLVDPRASHEAVRCYNGPKIFVGDSQFNDLLDFPGLPSEIFPEGGTVAHQAIEFAHYIGADPIILTGLDLSYSKGVTHIPGTSYFSFWKSDLNRFFSFEFQEWRFIRMERDNLLSGTDIEGHKTYSTKLFLTYRKDMEARFAKMKCRVINATEGGTVKNEVECLPLREAIDRFVVNPIPAELWPKAKLPLEQRRDRLSLSDSTVGKLLGRCREFEDCLGALNTLLTKARNRMNNNKSIDDIVPELNAYNAKLSSFGMIYELSRRLSSGDEYIRSKRLMEIRDESISQSDRNKQKIEIDRNWTEALSNSMKFFKNNIQRARLFLKKDLAALETELAKSGAGKEGSS